MPEPRRNPRTTQDQLIEDEMRYLEKPMLHSLLPWALAFVSIAILSGVITALVFTSPGETPHMRGESGLPLMTLAEPSGPIPEPPRTFRWQRYPGAVSYAVIVVESVEGEADRVVLVRPVSGLAMEPTDVELKDLGEGLYAWSVEARSADGVSIAQGLGAFSVQAGNL